MRMIAVLGAALVCAQSVVAQEPEATLDLDLNAVKQVDTSCQLTFVGRNGMAADITGIAAETVLFDTEGRVAVMTMLDFGELPSNRSRVRQFALANTSCDSIGQVLFNGVADL